MQGNRHFAYFDQVTGQCLLEREIPMTNIGYYRFAKWTGWRWLQNLWSTGFALPPVGTVGIDVTHLNLQVGDLVWARFNSVENRLEFNEIHHFITVHRKTGIITGNTFTPRPVWLNDAALQPFFAAIHLGAVERCDEVWGRAELEDGELKIIPAGKPLYLAPADIEPELQPLLVPELVRMS
jgi:hypothetical protein